MQALADLKQGAGFASEAGMQLLVGGGGQHGAVGSRRAGGAAEQQENARGWDVGRRQPFLAFQAPPPPAAPGTALQEATRHLMAKGLGRLPKPMLWLNGQQLPMKEGAGDTQVLQDMQMHLMYEVQSVQVGGERAGPADAPHV